MLLDKDASTVIIHQTHHEKSDWSRTFNQFTTACELDMINAISAADIAFIITIYFIYHHQSRYWACNQVNKMR